MTSFVHEELAALGQLEDFDDNRPRAVRCVHPLVTLLEKIVEHVTREQCRTRIRLHAASTESADGRGRLRTGAEKEGR